MYSDEELMLFAESYATMQKRGTAGKTIVGSVAERLNEKIDSQLRATQLQTMIHRILESEKMASAAEFLNNISITECSKNDYDKVKALYSIYEEVTGDTTPIDTDIEDGSESTDVTEDDEDSEDPDVAVVKAGFINDYKSENISIYKILLGFVEFGNWIMVHGKNDERASMKALLAVLEDQFVPKFSELPGADEPSDGAEEPAGDEEPADDEEGGEDAEGDAAEEA